LSEFQLSTHSAEEAVQQSLEKFGPARIALASSFGAEDQVLTDMLVRINPAARIFTLDTGRVFQETYDTMQRSMERYHIGYEVCVPEAADVAALIAKDGPNLFYASVENRKACCNVRKMKPLRKVLGTVDAWICGLRRDQSVTRTEVELVSWDAEFGIYKICPLFDWSEEQVWDYIKKNNVPYNALHDQGFPSIGCAPCTRAVGPGEDIRSGRWWWESPEHKECGLHRSPAHRNLDPGTPTTELPTPRQANNGLAGDPAQKENA
jgi:phosphoadenosine phosphosulfate reductase